MTAPDMMEAFTYGIRTGVRQWRIAGIVYLFQLLLAAAIGVQVYQVLEASIGNSLELNKLLDGYDHTVISDLINVHGASISPLIGQLRWVIAIYLVFSVFINAGMLYAVVIGEKRWMTFWKGGAKYFFPFLKLGLVFLLLLAVISGVIWGPFLPFFIASPEYFSSEKVSVWLLIGMLCLYLLLLVFLFSWSLVARIMILEERKRLFPVLKSSFRWLLRHYFPVTLLVLFFIGLNLIVFFVYWAINNPGVVSIAMMIVFIVFQQAVAYLRILLRLMIYGSFNRLYVRQ